MLFDAELKYIDRRTRLIRIWRYVGLAVLLILVLFTCYLFLNSPLLINPFHVTEQIEAGAIPQSTLLIMAAMMPLVMFVMVVLVVFPCAAFAIERKLLAIIQKLRDRKDHGR